MKKVLIKGVKIQAPIDQNTYRQLVADPHVALTRFNEEMCSYSRYRRKRNDSDDVYGPNFDDEEQYYRYLNEQNNYQDGYINHQDGYNNHQDGYNNHQDGYNIHQDGYNNHQDGYNNHQDGYNNHQDGYNDRQDGYLNFHDTNTNGPYRGDFAGSDNYYPSNTTRSLRMRKPIPPCHRYNPYPSYRGQQYHRPPYRERPRGHSTFAVPKRPPPRRWTPQSSCRNSPAPTPHCESAVQSDKTNSSQSTFVEKSTSALLVHSCETPPNNGSASSRTSETVDTSIIVGEKLDVKTTFELEKPAPNKDVVYFNTSMDLETVCFETPAIEDIADFEEQTTIKAEIQPTAASTPVYDFTNVSSKTEKALFDPKKSSAADFIIDVNASFLPKTTSQSELTEGNEKSPVPDILEASFLPSPFPSNETNNKENEEQTVKNECDKTKIDDVPEKAPKEDGNVKNSNSVPQKVQKRRNANDFSSMEAKIPKIDIKASSKKIKSKNANKDCQIATKAAPKKVNSSVPKDINMDYTKRKESTEKEPSKSGTTMSSGKIRILENIRIDNSTKQDKEQEQKVRSSSRQKHKYQHNDKNSSKNKQKCSTINSNNPSVLPVQNGNRDKSVKLDKKKLTKKQDRIDGSTKKRGQCNESIKNQDQANVPTKKQKKFNESTRKLNHSDKSTKKQDGFNQSPKKLENSNETTKNQDQSSQTTKKDDPSNVFTKKQSESNELTKNQDRTDESTKKQGQSNAPFKRWDQSNVSIKKRDQSNQSTENQDLSNVFIKKQIKSNELTKKQECTDESTKKQGHANVSIKKQDQFNQSTENQDLSNVFIKKQSKTNELTKKQECTDELTKKQSHANESIKKQDQFNQSTENQNLPIVFIKKQSKSNELTKKQECTDESTKKQGHANVSIKKQDQFNQSTKNEGQPNLSMKKQNKFNESTKKLNHFDESTKKQDRSNQSTENQDLSNVFIKKQSKSNELTKKQDCTDESIKKQGQSNESIKKHDQFNQSTKNQAQPNLSIKKQNKFNESTKKLNHSDESTKKQDRSNQSTENQDLSNVFIKKQSKSNELTKKQDCTDESIKKQGQSNESIKKHDQFNQSTKNQAQPNLSIKKQNKFNESTIKLNHSDESTKKQDRSNQSIKIQDKSNVFTKKHDQFNEGQFDEIIVINDEILVPEKQDNTLLLVEKPSAFRKQQEFSEKNSTHERIAINENNKVEIERSLLYRRKSVDVGALCHRNELSAMMRKRRAKSVGPITDAGDFFTGFRMTRSKSQELGATLVTNVVDFREEHKKLNLQKTKPVSSSSRRASSCAQDQNPENHKSFKLIDVSRSLIKDPRLHRKANPQFLTKEKFMENLAHAGSLTGLKDYKFNFENSQADHYDKIEYNTKPALLLRSPLHDHLSFNIESSSKALVATNNDKRPQLDSLKSTSSGYSLPFMYDKKINTEADTVYINPASPPSSTKTQRSRCPEPQSPKIEKIIVRKTLFQAHPPKASNKFDKCSTTNNNSIAKRKRRGRPRKKDVSSIAQSIQDLKDTAIHPVPASKFNKFKPNSLNAAIVRPIKKNNLVTLNQVARPPKFGSAPISTSTIIKDCLMHEDIDKYFPSNSAKSSSMVLNVGNVSILMTENGCKKVSHESVETLADVQWEKVKEFLIPKPLQAVTSMYKGATESIDDDMPLHEINGPENVMTLKRNDPTPVLLQPQPIVVTGSSIGYNNSILKPLLAQTKVVAQNNITVTPTVIVQNNVTVGAQNSLFSNIPMLQRSSVGIENNKTEKQTISIKPTATVEKQTVPLPALSEPTADNINSFSEKNITKRRSFSVPTSSEPAAVAGNNFGLENIPSRSTVVVQNGFGSNNVTSTVTPIAPAQKIPAVVDNSNGFKPTSQNPKESIVNTLQAVVTSFQPAVIQKQSAVKRVSHRDLAAGLAPYIYRILIYKNERNTFKSVREKMNRNLITMEMVVGDWKILNSAYISSFQHVGSEMISYLKEIEIRSFQLNLLLREIESVLKTNAFGDVTQPIILFSLYDVYMLCKPVCDSRFLHKLWGDVTSYATRIMMLKTQQSTSNDPSKQPTTTINGQKSTANNVTATNTNYPQICSGPRVLANAEHNNNNQRRQSIGLTGGYAHHYSTNGGNHQNPQISDVNHNTKSNNVVMASQNNNNNKKSLPNFRQMSQQSSLTNSSQQSSFTNSSQQSSLTNSSQQSSLNSRNCGGYFQRCNYLPGQGHENQSPPQNVALPSYPQSTPTPLEYVGGSYHHNQSVMYNSMHQQLQNVRSHIQYHSRQNNYNNNSLQIQPHMPMGRQLGLSGCPPQNNVPSPSSYLSQNNVPQSNYSLQNSVAPPHSYLSPTNVPSASYPPSTNVPPASYPPSTNVPPASYFRSTVYSQMQHSSLPTIPSAQFAVNNFRNNQENTVQSQQNENRLDSHLQRIQPLASQPLLPSNIIQTVPPPSETAPNSAPQQLVTTNQIRQFSLSDLLRSNKFPLAPTPTSVAFGNQNSAADVCERNKSNDEQRQNPNQSQNNFSLQQPPVDNFKIYLPPPQSSAAKTTNEQATPSPESSDKLLTKPPGSSDGLTNPEESSIKPQETRPEIPEVSDNVVPATATQSNDEPINIVDSDNEDDVIKTNDSDKEDEYITFEQWVEMNQKVIDLEEYDDIFESKYFKQDIKNEEQETMVEEFPPEASSPDSGICTPKLDELNICFCGVKAAFVCSCRSVIYCSRRCQAVDWDSHRKDCKSQ